MWNALVDWFYSLGAAYGVDPLVFGSISVGAIPFFWLSVAWLVRNVRRGKPIVLPVIATGCCVLSAYVYLFIAGENLPLWVYGLVAALVGYSAYSTIQTVKTKTAAPPDAPPSDLTSDSTGDLTGDPQRTA